MATFSFPLPPQLRGANLQAELETAFGLPHTDPLDRSPDTVTVSVDGQYVTITLPLDPPPTEAAVAAVVAAHTGQPTPAQQADAAEEAEAQTVFGDFTPAQLAKIRDVYAGNSAFTVAQRDRLLAGLALLVHRRLR